MNDRRPPRPDVEVRTSARRRKTASGFWQDGRVVILVPARLSKADRVELVEGLVQRVLAQRPNIATSDRDFSSRPTKSACVLSWCRMGSLIAARCRLLSSTRRCD